MAPMLKLRESSELWVQQPRACSGGCLQSALAPLGPGQLIQLSIHRFAVHGPTMKAPPGASRRSRGRTPAVELLLAGCVQVRPVCNL